MAKIQTMCNTSTQPGCWCRRSQTAPVSFPCCCVRPACSCATSSSSGSRSSSSFRPCAGRNTAAHPRSTWSTEWWSSLDSSPTMYSIRRNDHQHIISIYSIYSIERIVGVNGRRLAVIQVRENVVFFGLQVKVRPLPINFRPVTPIHFIFILIEPPPVLMQFFLPLLSSSPYLLRFFHLLLLPRLFWLHRLLSCWIFWPWWEQVHDFTHEMYCWTIDPSWWWRCLILLFLLLRLLITLVHEPTAQGGHREESETHR